MVNNSKPAGKLEGTGLVGVNGGEAKSANKMNIVMNKLIKALNQYMEAPKEKAEGDVKNNKKAEAPPANSKNNNKGTVSPTYPANAAAPVTIVNAKNNKGATAPTAAMNTASVNGKPATQTKNNTVNVINPLEKAANKSGNAAKALGTRKNRAAFMKTKTFKGGKRKNLKRSKTHSARA